VSHNFLKTFGKQHFEDILYLWLIQKTVSVLNTMKDIRYSVVVDPDVEYSLKRFETEIAMYLADPNGWGKFYEFEHVKRNSQVIIHLSSPLGIRQIGCENPNLSCAEMGGKHLRVNAMRWTKGSVESKLPLDEYRQYVISHEMGHILGYDHTTCPGQGYPAPVMMQQTLGIGTCSPNNKLTDIDVQSKKKR
jgi:hypothetical protein